MRISSCKKVTDKTPEAFTVNNPVQVERSGTQLGAVRRCVLHVARRTGVFLYTGAAPRERQGAAFDPELRLRLARGYSRLSPTDFVNGKMTITKFNC
ncbi:MAG: hypothetical protein LBF69_04905 [Prevotellaceae bacterium]|jgi:hypothetical protein|nr:hypothetical protein [Prevotellaceae bacterium]